MLQLPQTAREGLLCVSLTEPGGALETLIEFLPRPRQWALLSYQAGEVLGKPGLRGTNSRTGCLHITQAVGAFVCLDAEILPLGLAYPAASGNLLCRR